MTDQFGHFVASGPVEPEDDALFGTRPDFVLNLKSIAEHIVASSRAPHPSPMIFGLYGRWGAGKSSALRFVEGLIAEAAERNHVRTFLSQFDAPLWEQHNNVRASMALQILLNSPDALTKATDLLSQLRPVESGNLLTNDGVQWDLQSSIRFLDALGRHESAPPMLEHWLREMIGRGVASGESRPVHVIFVDDLDRCSVEFTVQLLVATNYWMSARGASIYFVLAASRAHLLESLKRSTFPLGPLNPEEALEKYVHLSFEVPDMLTNSREIALFLSKLIESSVSNVERERIGELQDLLKLGPDDNPLSSVFAPLLHPADGRVTPRAIKHRLNTFLAEFRPQGQVQLTPELVKRWILKAFWPDFWWRMIWPAETLDEPSASRIVSLRAIGRKLTPLWAMERARLQIPFEHLAAAGGVALDPMDDPVVAIYLASEPAWEPPTRQQAGNDKLSATPSDSSDTTIVEGSTGDAREMEPLDQGAVSSAHGIEGGSSTMPDDIQNQLILNYVLAKQEEKSNPSEALRRTREVLKTAKRLDDLGAVASTVGNAALVAERLQDNDLAIELHCLAVRARPDHENINLNYARCVLDAQKSDHYEEAAEAIRRALSIPGGQQEFRAKVLTLRVRLAVGEELSEIASDFEKLRLALTQSPKPDDLSRLLFVTKKRELRWLTTIEALHETCKAVLFACHTDAERHQTLKLLADTLFFWGDNTESELDAAKIYLFLLKTGVLSRFGSPADAEANIGYVLRKLGYKNAGLVIYMYIYRRSAASNWLRRALALALNDQGDGKAAAAALLGQELPTITVEPEELPVDLLDSSQRWWAGVSWDASYPPSTSKVLEILGQASA
ncbi:KAP family NTPase [Micromonospora yasonensis]|uniref:KAP family NTPase n=1 Tax=Micromonospora yasonensis TaxID=1128667 RepID=UPI0022313203|nr:KAP family NTPase [Micromonospora yasonensis]MCW3844503.1 KAP family NTPase [Micromonospora yasonensis]